VKLLLMEARPFGHKSHGPWRQLARNDSQAVDRDFRFGFCVLSVKVRRSVIREVHLDDVP
jgi:hypothetical protein